DAEPRSLCSNAQVAGERDAEAAADAVARDHGDGRLAHAGQRHHRPGRGAIIGGAIVAVAAVQREFADIGAGAERAAAGAAKDDTAYALVRVEAGGKVG